MVDTAAPGAAIAQLVEHVLGKDEVLGSIPNRSSMFCALSKALSIDNLEYFLYYGGRWMGPVVKEGSTSCALIAVLGVEGLCPKGKAFVVW